MRIDSGKTADLTEAVRPGLTRDKVANHVQEQKKMQNLPEEKPAVKVDLATRDAKMKEIQFWNLRYDIRKK